MIMLALAIIISLVVGFGVVYPGVHIQLAMTAIPIISVWPAITIIAAIFSIIVYFAILNLLVVILKATGLIMI